MTWRDTSRLRSVSAEKLPSSSHSQADLRDGCVPVGWQFSLLIVKAGLNSCKVIGILVTPKPSAVMESFLKYKQEPISFTLYT